MRSIPWLLRSGRRAANRGSQRRTALRTRRSIAASRRTSWPRGRRCVQWAHRREADPARRSRCASPRRPIEMKRAIDVVPEREARAAAERLQLPADVAATPVVLEQPSAPRPASRWSRRPAASALPPSRASPAPTAPRLRSASNGAHSRRCAGSVSACQTFAGGWRSSRTRTSVHFSPSFLDLGAGRGAGRVLSHGCSSSSFLSWMVPAPSGRGGVRAHRRGPTRSAGTEPARHRPP